MTDTLKTIYIEDDDQEAFIMQVGMRRQGIEIIHLADVSLDNLADLQAPPHDSAAALIFDAFLTAASGADLAQKLRDNGDKRPIILLTAGENPDPKQLARMGIVYMRKPPDYATLADLIRSAAAG